MPCTHSQLPREKCKNYLVHPKISPDVSQSQTLPLLTSQGNGFRQIWTRHQKLGTCPTPQTHQGWVWVLGRFGLSIKSGKHSPTPDTWNLGFRQIWNENVVRGGSTLR